MKNLHRIFVLLLLTLLVSCSNDTTNETQSDSLLIYTSLYPIQYAAERIGGELAQVETVYPPGVDAHSYEPTSKEITELSQGDLFIYLGANMEGFADTVADALASQDVLMLEIGKNKDLFYSLTEAEEDEAHEQHEHHEDEDDHDHGQIDPHIWLDPLLMVEMGQMIKDEMIKLSPEDEAEFNSNFASYKADLEKLNEDYADTLTKKDNPVILVTHAAYGYIERNYGIKQLSISGLTTHDEPSQKELANITRQAEKENIKYLIYDQFSDNKTAEIVQKHLNAEKLVLHNLEVLTEEDIKNDSDYLSLMESNLIVLDEATN